ncbi:fatty acid amide hydrolase-like isoform X2 [Punica granatum]|uniref:Fatty acid amide hydrolase-like isoform X2 n=2 Tax=Punica granatum TaxID=22663 RepID=A0A6P8DX06_PUNGR|nr:fatty acid amide hydrolase-like isoform X2 [Punica granatum]
MGIFSAKGVVYKAVKDVDLGPNSDEYYLRANVKAPRMAGFLVKIFVWFLESRIFGSLLLYLLKRNNLIHKLVTNAEMEEAPVFVPLHPLEDLNEREVVAIESDSSVPGRVQQAVECIPLSVENSWNGPKTGSFGRWTIMDYARAYSSREITPLMVAEKFIAAVTKSSKTPLQMSFFINFEPEDILRQAEESTIRYKRGEPISALDGVPIAVKDEIDCLPYPTTGGTKWLHRFRQCKADACCVARLRLCGAILVGKTNMHELGAGTSGINPHYGTARNPYDTRKITGGSSSGSAAVVAAGLCPVALGVDGGGSVRMPAALCGVVGLKPTFSRIPNDGYAAISGNTDPNPANSSPKIHYPLLKSAESMPGIRLAKYGEWFNDCSEEIKASCFKALDRLRENYGWKVMEVTIPEIETMRLAHYATIGTESSTSLSTHLKNLDYAELGWDARVALAVYGAFSGKEYIKAQKIRNRQMQFHNNIFAEADVIVSPMTGVTAYPILDDARETGELDYINGAALVRYSIVGNFLGLPAITVPVGYDKAGLPIGLQLIGRPWSEATLIHIAYAIQALYVGEYKRPEVYYDLLH